MGRIHVVVVDSGIQRISQIGRRAHDASRRAASMGRPFAYQPTIQTVMPKPKRRSLRRAHRRTG